MKLRYYNSWCQKLLLIALILNKLLFFKLVKCSSSDETLSVDSVSVNEQIQNQQILKVQSKCLNDIIQNINSNDTEHCPFYWDTVICWPKTRIGEASTVPCPEYIYKLNSNSNYTFNFV
jgi:hypothetical protein